ncbi:hypothetical protein BD626DRAFT_93415 [Schizophyllum amplum]|uniref:Uncharacterized protein n=1 Tax=Schizophyllum amplum TaxID=97359 RepID=A0A550BRY5_9AGAR|nr:hypothetical protein BD626DRAFT_93415 [Auriculariopsis ampla]
MSQPPQRWPVPVLSPFGPFIRTSRYPDLRVALWTHRSRLAPRVAPWTRESRFSDRRVALQTYESQLASSSSHAVPLPTAICFRSLCGPRLLARPSRRARPLARSSPSVALVQQPPRRSYRTHCVARPAPTASLAHHPRRSGRSSVHRARSALAATRCMRVARTAVRLYRS